MKNSIQVMEATPLQDITNLAPAGAGMPPAEAAARKEAAKTLA